MRSDYETITIAEVDSRAGKIKREVSIIAILPRQHRVRTILRTNDDDNGDGDIDCQACGGEGQMERPGLPLREH
jgi:hypothetical protein